jgi:hypothetical protein
MRVSNDRQQEDQSWTLVTATDISSGQALCRQHGARLGAFTR